MKYGRPGGYRVRDKDALTFFTTAGITNPSEKIALNQLILKVKERGLWNKFDNFYPMSKTSLSAALYCAKTLLQATAVNNPTFSASGVTFDGTTQYIDTGIQTGNLVQSTTSSSHQCVYTNGAFLANGVSGNLMGSAQTIASNTCRWLMLEDGTNNLWVPRLYLTVLAGSAQARANGCILGSRTDASTTFLSFRNSTTVTTSSPSTAASGASPTTNRVFIGCIGAGSASTPTGFAKQTIAFVSFGGALSTQEGKDLCGIVQEYQIMMGRAA